MTPTKCPNCRLSLPQNWSGANDPNAKCPYCGKAITGGVASPPASTTTGAASAAAVISAGISPPAAPSPGPAPAPAPAAPRAAAKTILWGAGMPLPGRMPDKPAAPSAPAPAPRPVSTVTSAPAGRPVAAPSPMSPFGTKAPLGESATVPRNAVPESLPPPAPPAAPAAEPGFDVDISEAPAPAPAAQPTGRPAPARTVMFESAVHGASLRADVERADGPAADAPTEAADEPEPPAEPSPRPTPTRNKPKVRPMTKKGGKPKAGFSSNRRDEDEDDAGETKPSSSKAGLIVFIALLVCGGAIIAFVLLRGKAKHEAAEEPATKSKPLVEPTAAPSDEPAALAPKRAAEPVFTPPPIEKPAKPVAEKPAPAEKPARPDKADKTAHADKPKAEPTTAPAEPKPVAGKPTEEDYRRASEAYQRGNTKLFQGNTAGAIDEFNQALRLNPKDPSIHRGLGLAFAQSGNAAEATKHLKAYLKAAPKANDRAMIEKKLDQLQGK